MSKKILLILIFISLILFIFSFAYFLFVNNDRTNDTPYYKTEEARHIDLTTIIQKEFWSEYKLQDNTKLLAKQIIKENFIASIDNLGIIFVPFDTHNKSINDKLIFRLKEEGEKDWYYQGIYNTNQFQNNIPFPFGFPIITNSKNISYTFEIESLDGTSENSISISDINKHFFTKYKFSKSELVTSPKELFDFIVAKTSEQVRILTVTEIVYILFFLLSPFIMYWVVIFLVKKIGLGVRKKILKKINRVFLYRQKIGRYLIASIKKITIMHPLDRKTKIKLCSLIISVGFFFSISFHYFQGTYYRQGFPQNTFIPNWFFGDLFLVLDQWSRFKFMGVGYGLSYFPGTYLFIDLLVKVFTNPYIAVIVYLIFFTVFTFLYVYKNVKTNKFIESLQNAFIISLMSYPFLFAFQTANVEIITFISVCIFFIFYKSHKTLSLLALVYAISMKVFPGIFITLLLLEKRYKDIFLTCMFIILFMLLPLLIFDGGFNKGIGNYIARLKESQRMYVDLMIMSDAGNHYGHSLLNGLRSFLPSFPSMKIIMFPYQIFTLVIFLVIVGYLIFFEKTFWKRVACLVMMMNLLPFTSTDYKLLYIFLPLFFLINHSKRDKYDAIFIILFSLLLIPKDYFYFNNNSLSTFNVVANPIIMLFILLLIIFSGITSNLRQAKIIFNNNKLLRKITRSI